MKNHFVIAPTRQNLLPEISSNIDIGQNNISNKKVVHRQK